MNVLAAAGALDPQGPVAESMADLWWLMLWLGIAVFVIFGVLLALGLYRRRAEAEPGTSTESSGLIRNWIVAGGVVMPLVVLLVVYGATLKSMQAVPTAAASDALTIEVVGHQWWYEVHYPDQGVTTANEIHLPIGREIEFELTSADVIHSFWVPELGGKTDMLPDGVNTMVYVANEPAEYRARCAEFCGLMHTRMGVTVVAEPADEFETWIADQQEPAPEPTGAAARRGQEVFLDAGCASCHAIEGTASTTSAPGPDLTHLASRSTLAAGSLSNNEENLERWISDPHEVKNGVKMPPNELTQDEIDAVVAYLRTLE